MSADNGVYILKTRKGNGFQFRVEHLSAIDNLDYDCRGPEDVMKNARQMWGRAKPVFRSRNSAIVAAHDLAMGIDILEYGVSEIDLSDPQYGEF